MPPKRSASGPKAKSHQSTLAFHGTSNKVTKSGTRAQIAKKGIVDEPVVKAEEPEVADISVTEETEPSTVEAAIIEQTEQEIIAQQEKSTPEEDEAQKVSDEAIKKYWAEKEKRKAPRVHQEDLSTHEKILREFDMSGQYGPSTGIARLKRWKRAHKLKLNPPIEVLAVLLKEQEVGDKVSVQRSHVDELLNSRNVELEIGA